MAQYPVRELTEGVYVFGPHAINFWAGNFAPLRNRFAQLADAMEDKSSEDWANAQRLIVQISMDRSEADALSKEDRLTWLVNMPVVELTPAGSGLLVYSPVPLDDAGTLQAVLDELGPVKVVVAPMGGHTSGLASFRAAYPDAVFLCSRGGGFLGMNIIEQHPEIGFHLGLSDASSIAKDKVLSALLGDDFEVEVTQDNALFEIILYHRPSRTVLSADTIYKTGPQGAGPGPGGPFNCYLSPPWFASAYQTLNLDPSPNRTLPDNRFFLAKHSKFNRVGLIASLRRVLSWDIDWLLCSHTDPLTGSQAKQAVRNSWGWLLDEDD